MKICLHHEIIRVLMIDCDLRYLQIKLPNGDIKSITFAYCIIAAGAESGQIAKLAGIGTGEGILQMGVPVERRFKLFIII